MNKDQFIKSVKENLGIDLNSTQISLLSNFADLLLEYNKHTNLTAIRDLEGVYLKHFYDSLTLVKAIDLSSNLSLLDVGSGGGFPGIVLKIVFPNLDITLLDSNRKKTDFHKYIIEKLSLENIRTVNMRAEDFFKEGNRYDIVVARAVANMQILSELCIPFVKINGYFVAMKGNNGEEMQNSMNAINKLGGSLKDTIKLSIMPDDERYLFRVKKEAETPKEYPRAYDRIIKKPLQ